MSLRKKLNAIEKDSIDDADIRKYLPDAKIMKYSDLGKYASIDALLPNNPDYVFILYEDSVNKGHWTLVLRYGNTYEFFCSYGSKVDEPLTWTTEQTKERLHENYPYLTRLFDTVPTQRKIIYNPVDYQQQKSDINTCGRHAIVRALSLLRQHMPLKAYYRTMKNIKDKTGNSYDDIVSSIITDL
jgi:hypothetical protein